MQSLEQLAMQVETGREDHEAYALLLSPSYQCQVCKGETPQQRF